MLDPERSRGLNDGTKGALPPCRGVVMRTSETGRSPPPPPRLEAEEQFRELMAHLHQVFWIKNRADDAVTYISPAYATICGRSCQSLYDDYQSFLDGVHPEDRERVAAVMAHQSQTDGYDQEYRIVRPDGAVRWLWVRSYPVHDAAGRVTRYAGIADDITERKSLEEDRARLAAIVEYSEDAILNMSGDGIITSWNHGAERQYGYAAEEIVGCPISTLFPPDDYREYERVLASVRQGEVVAAHDTVRRRKDGTTLHTRVSIFPIRARSGALVGSSKIGRDVTRLKEVEAQFIAAQRMDVVGQLAARMVHDFNNLLFVISNTSDFMMKGLKAGSPLHENAATIRQAAGRAAGLTRQLLVFSRTDQPKPESVDLNDAIKRLEPMVRRVVDDRIQWSLVLGAEVGRIEIDAGHLEQLVLNLVVNARDAMAGGGELFVTTSRVTPSELPGGVVPGDYAVVTVRDTGEGMSDEVRGRLFEPFFTTKAEGDGTGLGLAICDTIVKGCGGHIVVSSELGRGATFEVFLPSVERPIP